MREFFPRKGNQKMQKPIDNKQTWMNSALNKGIVIGNAQIGPASSRTVIGNAVIGGMTAAEMSMPWPAVLSKRTWSVTHPLPPVLSAML